MEHECAIISGRLGDICAADHVVKISPDLHCSGITTNCEVHNGGATSAVGILLSLVVS